MRLQKYKKRLSNIPSNIWSEVAQIDELKGKWVGSVNLNPYLLGRLKKSVLVTSSGASTRIEGARLSDEEVEKLMQGIALQKFSERDEQEVKGYYELLENVFNSYPDISFSENIIKHFHQELLKYVEKDKQHRGKYKSRENKVEMLDKKGRRAGILFDTTPAYLTPKQMQELTEWTKKELATSTYHPLLLVANFIVEFLKIHPFEDGNGRLSRILTNLLLLKNGYLYMPYISHEKLIEEKKIDYYIALRKSQRTFGKRQENIFPWTGFFIGILLEQAKQAVNLLSGEAIEDILSPSQLAVWKYLQSTDEASPREISQKTGVPKPTVSQALTKLIKLKKVKRLGVGRSTRYREIS